MLQPCLGSIPDQVDYHSPSSAAKYVFQVGPNQQGQPSSNHAFPRRGLSGSLGCWTCPLSPKQRRPPKSWLVLNLPSILHDVYGTLFSQSKEIVNKFGLLQRRHLAELFPHLDLEMVQQLLISLEFCLPVNPAILKVDLSELNQSKETSGWFSSLPSSPQNPLSLPSAECLLPLLAAEDSQEGLNFSTSSSSQPSSSLWQPTLW